MFIVYWCVGRLPTLYICWGSSNVYVLSDVGFVLGKTNRRCTRTSVRCYCLYHTKRKAVSFGGIFRLYVCKASKYMEDKLT